MIDRLKERFYRKSLPTRVVRGNAARARNLDDAKNIALLFNATDIDDRKRSLAYADKLRKQNKQVSVLGFISTADKEATFAFDFFSLNDIDWAERPKGDTVQHWLRNDYSALVCLFPKTNRFTEFLALHCRASLKIGPVASHPDCYDLMLDMPKQSSPDKIIHELERILARTVPQVV